MDPSRGPAGSGHAAFSQMGGQRGDISLRRSHTCGMTPNPVPDPRPPTDETERTPLAVSLWFDRCAQDAVEHYTRAFRSVTVERAENYPADPAELPDFQRDLAGELLALDLRIEDLDFTFINADDTFRPTPSLNLTVNFDPARHTDARAYLDRVHAVLMEGGRELMPLDAYPFSPHYAWVEDRFGVSWQLMVTNPDGQPRPFLLPSLSFGGPQQNRAAEAVDYYLQTFTRIFGPDLPSGLGHLYTYGEFGGVPDLGPGVESPVTAESVIHADFRLAGQWCTAMDPGAGQDFTFTEGVSLIVYAQDQAQIDALWEALSHVPEAEACGWCKDRFGLSWQIVPRTWPELSTRPGAYQTMMGQKKIIIAEY